MRFNNETFLNAAKTGDVAVLEAQLQEKDANVNVVDNHENQNYAIILAADQGHTRAVKLLIEKRAWLNVQACNKATALLAALKNGHQNIVQFLLEQDRHIALDAQDENGDTALHLALQKNDRGLAEKLIVKGASPFLVNKAKQVPAEDPWLKEYLTQHFCPSTFVNAAEKGDLETLRAEAAKQGFNVNARAKVTYIETALTTAAYQGQVAVVQFLLQQAGIDLYAPSWDESYFTASQLAAYRNHKEVLRLLIAAGINENEQYQALKESVKFSHLETAKYLIDEVGLNINHSYKSDNTTISVIHWFFAGPKASKDLLRFLLEKGVKDKGFALRRCARYQDKEYLEIILKHGVDVNEADPETGYTALMLAAEAGKLGNVRLLLAQGADPFLKNKKGETALDLANLGDYQSFKEKKKGYAALDICIQYHASLEVRQALHNAMQTKVDTKRTWRKWEIAGAVVTGLIGALSAGFAAVNYFGLSAWLGSTTAGFMATLSLPLWINFALLGVGALLLITAVGLGIAAIVNKISSNTLEKQLVSINEFCGELFRDALTFRAKADHEIAQRRQILDKQLQYGKHFAFSLDSYSIQDGNYSCPPLIYAARMDDAATVKGLLDAGANIERTDFQGHTALAHAVYFKYEEVVKVLLQCGAAIDTGVEKWAISTSKEIKGLLEAEKQKRAKPADVVNASAYQFRFQQPASAVASDKQALLADSRTLKP